MIKNKNDLNTYLNEDMPFFRHLPKRDKLICWLVKDPIIEIDRYVRYLRKEEYYFNCQKGKLDLILHLWYLRRKNKLGNRLGFKVPKNTFGPGLMIYHHGELIVNENVRIGANAKLHGGNCIGNNGKDNKTPKIGDNLDMGIGSKIIGPIILGSQVKIGTNAVVTKSFDENDITLVGIPAKKVN